MKAILKSAEPIGFTRWKYQNPQAGYNDITRHVKSWLKDSLIDEQHSLCCYCECRIIQSNSHIEHFKPKAHNKFPELQLDYNNLHVSCGNNQKAGEDLHCGHKKSDEYSPLLVSPLESDCHTHFGYTMDGHISGNDDKGKESIRILHLDSELLNAQRKALIDYFLGYDDFQDFQNELKIHLNQDADKYGEFYTMIQALFQKP